ncbi:MAG: CcmD family protein [Dehalococcoidia bacterium]|nr:CcmD family protein [Dehalococcoidia bacterium]
MSTRYSNTLRKTLPLAKSAPIVLLGLIVAAFLAAPVYAGYGIVESATTVTGFAQASDSDPEANLPFLFAVYILTWAGFFGYAFYMSRRQRDMRRDIEALRKALREREDKDDASSQEESR